MIAAPEVGGGIDHVTDTLGAYLETKTADRELLIRYAVEFNSGVIFKRLGYLAETRLDRKSTRLNSSHGYISYAVFCLKKKNTHLLRQFTDATREAAT